MYVIVAYDICDDERRDFIRKVLRQYLKRVQYSVFEGSISEKNLRKLINFLKNNISRGDKLIVAIVDKKFERIVIGKDKWDNVL